MRTSALAVAVVLASAAGAQDEPKEQIEASSRKVKELQKERIATLKKVVEVSFKLAQTARLEFGDAIEDRMALLEAELEVAERESDRIALYTKALDDLKAYQDAARARFEAGRGTELAVHRIKAKRLETEIALERTKIKEAEGKK